MDQPDFSRPRMPSVTLTHERRASTEQNSSPSSLGGVPRAFSSDQSFVWLCAPTVQSLPPMRFQKVQGAIVWRLTVICSPPFGSGRRFVPALGLG